MEVVPGAKDCQSLLPDRREREHLLLENMYHTE